MYTYNEKFYQYIEKGAISSAEILIPKLLSLFEFESVLDVGCGRGAWLSIWKNHQIQVTGIDGDYVDRDTLLVEQDEFLPQDLSQEFSLGKKFSLVQSLEVAEHLPEESARPFIKSLCKHGDIVLFSAAYPGQGGENHINEQKYDYWQKKFAEQGFLMFDPLRLFLKSHSKVEPWYKYNSFIFIRETKIQRHQKLMEYNVENPKDIAPWIYRCRRKVLSILPSWVYTFLARLKKQFVTLKIKFS